MLKNYLYKVYYLFIPLLILGISYGYTSFPLTLAALFPLLFFFDRHVVGFFLLMYGGPLGGVIREMYPSIPVYGLLLQMIGILLMLDIVQSMFRKNSRALWGIIGVLLVFSYFYVIGPMDAFASKKYMTMIAHGVLMVLGYFAFCYSKKINAESLTLILIVSALCMIAFCINKYNFTPGGLLDYNWFRDQSMHHIGKWATGEHMIVGYQQIGMLVLYGIAIFLSQIELQKEKALYYALIAIQLIMMSGCRQAILGFLVVLAFRLFLFHKKNIGNRHLTRTLMIVGVGIVAFFAIAFLVMKASSSEVVSSTVSEGDEGRQFLMLEAIAIFQDFWLMGVGIGGFNALTGDEWPHNFFLELLCETGLVGTILLFVIVIYTLYQRKAGLLYVTSNGQFFFLFLMSLFVRVMVSSDLSESIELFSAIFAIPALDALVSGSHPMRPIKGLDTQP